MAALSSGQTTEGERCDAITWSRESQFWHMLQDAAY